MNQTKAKRFVAFLLCLLLVASLFLPVANLSTASSMEQSQPFLVGLKKEVNLDTFIEKKGLAGKGPKKAKIAKEKKLII